MTPKRTHALAVSAGLSVLFLIVYGGCNWITAHRGDVGVFYFEWERAIPFVPFLILPYMSIDLFYIAAPFLCRSERELSIFAKRVVAAILFAGTCFLLFPLRFAFFARSMVCFSGMVVPLIKFLTKLFRPSRKRCAS